MDSAADASALDVDFAPPVGLVAIPASIKGEPGPDRQPELGETSDFATAQNRVLSYLGEHLLKGSPEGVRDRINALLLDERYHQLISRAEATVPVLAVATMLDEGEMGLVNDHPPVPAALRGRYALASRIQFEVISLIMAAMPPVHGQRRRRLMRRIRVADRLAFLYDQNLPTTVKRAMLGGWVAPMCCLGVLANEGQADEATIANLLDEWIISMQHQLALGVALRQIGPFPEEVLPAEFQYNFSEIWGKYLEGLGRTMRRFATLEQDASPRE